MQGTKALRSPSAVNGFAIPPWDLRQNFRTTFFVLLPGVTPDPLFNRHPFGCLFQHTVRHQGWHSKEAPEMPKMQSRQGDQGAEKQQKGCFPGKKRCFQISETGRTANQFGKLRVLPEFQNKNKQRRALCQQTTRFI